MLFSCSEKEVSNHKNSAKKHKNPYYEKAFVFLDKNEQDSAFYYLNKGKDLFTKLDDSLGIGKSYVNMAIIQETTGDNFGSIESSITASKFLKENDTTHYQSVFCNYNNLGVASNNLKNYNDAKRFYDKALHFTKDPIDKMSLANNIAIVYHNEKQYGKAVEIYQKLIDSVGLKSEFYPKLLLNYSRSKWFENQNYSPVQNYLKAELLSESFQDDWTKDASYAYLSAYYLNKNKDSAKLYSEKMLSLAKDLKYPIDQLEALQNLIRISDAAHSQNYFEDYSKIQDSLTNAQNKAKNQFALIRFESEKAKAENLIWQQEHEEHEHQVEIQKLIIWGIIIITSILSFFIFLWIKRRKRRLILEANNKLQEQRLDFSKRVHDVVANGIYEVMTTLENQNDVPKEKLLDKLELMYEKSRDLSYNKVSTQDFNEKIFGLVSSFDNENIKIIIIGNELDFWSNVSENEKEEWFQILRELLVNMKKHSQATQVILKFNKDNNKSEILYSDNGVGLAENFQDKNGFANIKSRLVELKAELMIEKNPSGGLKLSIKY